MVHQNPGEKSEKKDVGILSKMLREKIKDKHLSLRDTGIEIGVSHTTVARIIEGKEIDMVTVEKIAKWMNVPIATLLNVDKPNEELWNKLQVVFSQHPELYKIFNDFIDGVMNDEVASSILTEIVAYAEFRIKYSKEYGQV
jgi:transcriptional regulator with XRE-family HTH domain